MGGAEGHHHGAVLEEEALEEAVTTSWRRREVGLFAEEAKAGDEQPGGKRLVAVLWSELTRGKRSIIFKVWGVFS